MTKVLLALVLGALLSTPDEALAEEIVNRSVGLPGASMEQKIIFNPSEAEYVAARDARLKALQAGDPAAMVNPIDGPWMIVETTAMIGFSVGVDFAGLSVGAIEAMEGRTSLRRVTAAEEALFMFENN